MADKYNITLYKIYSDSISYHPIKFQTWACGPKNYNNSVTCLVQKCLIVSWRRVTASAMCDWCFTHRAAAMHDSLNKYLIGKCSICSYQLNIWYGVHVAPSILNWFLPGEWVQELAPTYSWVGLVLQYR